MRNTIKKQLEGVIPEDRLQYLHSSFDILGSKSGSVAIIEVPEELTEYRLQIAQAIQTVHKNVKSVLGKTSERFGEYRLRELELLSGDPDTEIIHKESGCRFKIDPRVTYFSTRESTERERINSKITEHENILVMFSGAGPFPVCIAKKHPTVTVTAVELNPDAHRYAVENVNLNKVTERVTPLLGDVREVCPAMGQVFDRVLMPLPKGAFEFLDVAIPLVKPGGVLHFYHWAPEEDKYSEAQRLVKEAAEQYGREASFTDGVKVSLYSPRVCKVRIDAVIQ
ncbi:MAG: class I SAM-dependent methyltransferase family protein [Candidatus Bathyarchaeota archaeon]|nr:class I SAM-dependent methyltransferase family protein [Candidatus Bathyarchaeota archaeon]